MVVSDLILPARILDQHLVVLGKTGAGKSSALRHIVEHLLNHKKRVCIIDPKGDWWGLKWSADGKSAGFPIIAFGDFKEARATDIPLNAQAGKGSYYFCPNGTKNYHKGFTVYFGGTYFVTPFETPLQAREAIQETFGRWVDHARKCLL